MKRKTLLIGLLLAVLVSFSGCLGGSASKKSSGAHPGILITDFRSDFGEVDSAETTMVALDFDNRGDYPASNVEGNLIRKGAFTETNQFYDETEANIEKPLNDVYSGDEFYWDLKAPAVSQDRIEEVQARISYTYQTEAYATLNFVPQDILRDQGAEAFSMSPYTSNSPVSISIEANQPVILRKESVGDTKNVRVNLVFSNVGTGRVDNESIIDTALQCSKADGCIDTVTVDTVGDSCKVVNEEKFTIYKCCVDSSDFYKWQKTCDAGNDFMEVIISKCLTNLSQATCDDACNSILESVGEVTAGPNECNCTHIEQYSDTLNGIKLVKDQQGRYSFSENFLIANTQAATSCQLHVKAEYRYHTDSAVLPITIRKVD